MNTIEMMKKLYESPKLKAKSHNCTRSDDILINRNGALLWYNKHSNYLFECCSVNMSAEWKIIQEPVSWQEAIQGWIDGKTVKIENEDGSYYCFLKQDTFLCMNNTDFTNYNWYICD
jgi:hypothetical protein